MSVDEVDKVDEVNKKSHSKRIFSTNGFIILKKIIIKTIDMTFLMRYIKRHLKNLLFRNSANLCNATVLRGPLFRLTCLWGR
jgi:flagellar biosynthesis protein FlhB